MSRLRIFFTYRQFLGALLFLVSGICTGQVPNANWFFGQNAGISFLTTPPTVLMGSSMNTTEGCASVSDPAGNLLFYTDGSTIWDQNHNVMANGAGLNSHQTTTQSSIIIRRPGSWTEYYVFSLTSFGSGTLSVSMVDMTLAGTGSVTVKNQQVGTGLAEKLCYTQHCNGVDWWVVAHADYQHTYYAWLVTGAGVSGTPVVSNIGQGSIVQNAMWTGLHVTFYSMKISPGGDRIAKTVMRNAVPPITNVGWQVSDFNNSTGVISGWLELQPQFTIAPSPAPPSPFVPYGVEFSPDGSKLYGSVLEGDVYQWDLCAGSDSLIKASRYRLTQNSPVKGALQAAPDGKVYLARHGQSNLGVINSPNLPGALCNYVDIGPSIAPGICQFGLPNLSPVKVPPPPFTYTMNNCFTATFTPPPLAPLSNYVATSCSSAGYSITGIQWHFGDPASGTANTSTLVSPTHSFSGLGTYTTMFIINYSCRGGPDTLRQVINITQPCFTFTGSGVSCASAGSATVEVQGLGPYSYTWLPGNTTGSVATGITPGTYSVLVTHVPTSITFSYQATFPPTPVAGSLNAQTTLLCNGVNNGTAQVSMSGTSGNHQFSWTNGTTSITGNPATALSAGNWSLFVSDNITGCQWDTVFTVTQPPPLVAGITASSPTACVGSSVQLTGLGSGGTPPFVYSWVNGPASAQYSVAPAQGGTYVYTFSVVDSYSCAALQTVAVQFINNPALSVTHMTACPGASVVLSATGAITFTWSNSANGFSTVVSPTASTNYSVTGSAFGCSSSTVVSVNVLNPPNPIIGVPSLGCEGKSAILNVIGGVAYLWNGPAGFTSTAQSPVIAHLTQAHAGTYSVIVFSAAGCTAQATGVMQINPVPTLAVTGYSACESEPVVMTVTAIGASTISWTGPNSFTASGTGASFNSVSPANAGNYSIMATSGAGCVQSATFHLNVLPRPIPTFTLERGYICDSPTQLSPVTLSITASGAPSYSLQLPSYLYMVSAYGPTMVIAAAAAPNQPTVPVATATIIGDNGVCSEARLITFSVIPNPTLSQLPSAPEICAGESLTFSVTGAGTYSWSAPGATLSPLTGSVTVVTATNNVTIAVTGGVLGCLSEKQTVYLTVHDLPLVAIQPPHQRICFLQQATLTASGNGETYLWPATAGMPSTPGKTVIVKPAQSGNYTVIATANGCTNAAVASVTVWPLPEPAAVLSKDTACVGDEITLNASGAVHYLWQAPTGGTYEGKKVKLQLEHKGFSGVFRLTATDSNGCVETATTSLSVYDPPSGFLFGPMEGCTPFCPALTFSATTGVVIAQWNVVGNTIQGDKIKYCFKVPGTHTIAGRFTDPVTSCVARADFLVEVMPGVEADFDFYPEEPVENLDVVEFRNLSRGESAKKHHWYVIDHHAREIVSENITHLFETAGRFKVVLVTENEWGCIDTVAKPIVVRSDFNVYVPNSFTPNGDGTNDLFIPVMRGVERMNLRVFDRWGERVFESFDLNTGWDGNQQGKPVKQDVYVWLLEVTLLSGERQALQGHVTLLR